MQVFDQSVPIPLSCPDTLDRCANTPARLFQLGQCHLHNSSLLLLSPRCVEMAAMSGPCCWSMRERLPAKAA